MSGYFSQLVARSSGTAEVVRPRVLSFFEPPKPEASLRISERDFDQASVSEQTDRVEDFTMRPSQNSVQETARLAREEFVPSLFEPAVPGKEGRLSKSHRDSRSKHAEVSELGVGEKRVSGDGAHLTPGGLPHSPAANHEIAKPGRERLETEKPVVVPRIAQSPAIERVVEAGPQPQAIFAMEESRRKSLRAVSENRPLPSFDVATAASAVSPSFLAPIVAKRFEKPDAGANLAAPGNEPTVHVTIGRVEVRATLADKPRRKEQAATAVMSLADYLRNQRSGVGR